MWWHLPNVPQHSGKVWYIKNSICAFTHCIFPSLWFNITVLVSALQDAVRGHIQSEKDNFAAPTPGRSSQNEKQRGSHWAGVYKIMIQRENNQSTRWKKKCSVCRALTWQKQTAHQPSGSTLPTRPLGLEGLAALSRTRLTAGLPVGCGGFPKYRVLNCLHYKPVLAKTTLKITGRL